MAASSTCRNDGSCDGQGACQQYPNGTECSPPSCVDGSSQSTEYLPAVCSGGGCPTASSASCGQFKCGGNACRDTCSQNSHCASGSYCASTDCVPKLGVGEVCLESGDCTTNICNGYEESVRPGRCCTTPANCDCPGPAFDNLLSNPGFDDDLDAWDFENNFASYSWEQFSDQDLCPYSGALQVTLGQVGYVDFRQCVPVSGGTEYTFGGAIYSSRLPEYLNGEPQAEGTPWQADCTLAFYATLEVCENHLFSDRLEYNHLGLDEMVNETYEWFGFSGSHVAPNLANAAALECSALDDYAPNTYLIFDKLYITPDPGAY